MTHLCTVASMAIAFMAQLGIRIGTMDTDFVCVCECVLNHFIVPICFTMTQLDTTCTLEAQLVTIKYIQYNTIQYKDMRKS